MEKNNLVKKVASLQDGNRGVLVSELSKTIILQCSADASEPVGLVFVCFPFHFQIIFASCQSNDSDFQVMRAQDIKKVKKCHDCGRSFGMFNRRHLCNLCGQQVICNKCAIKGNKQCGECQDKQRQTKRLAIV